MDDDNFDDSKHVPLKFQERSPWQHFREMDVDETGLMNRPQAAHLTIFVTSAHILDSVEESSDDRDEIFWFSALRGSYARDYWIQHLLEIDVEEVPDAD